MEEKIRPDYLKEFENELKTIVNKEIKQLIEDILVQCAPDYFVEAPA